MRALHESPTRAAVSGGPNTDLAAGNVAATGVIVTDNGLHLGIDVARVARRNRNVHSTQLIAGGDVNKGEPLPAFMGAPVE